MIPKTMKAAVIQEYGQSLKIQEVPVKTPGRYEVLVKVIACGVCHTDLQKSLSFTNEGLVKATVTAAKLEDINDVFEKMKKGQIDGRIVLDIAGAA